MRKDWKGGEGGRRMRVRLRKDGEGENVEGRGE